MNVLVVEPGCLPYEKEISGLEQMQAVVGGLIQPIYPYEEPVAIVCNEEGIINGMPFNRSVPGGYGGVFGPFFICGLEEDHFCSLTPNQMKRFKTEFAKAELLIGAKGNDPITLKFPAEQKPDKERGKPSPGHDR
ncbi:MAG: DUF3846 domain-containing protein [Oscillospiraceae bacterium]